MNVQTVTVQFDVQGDTPTDAAEVLCRILDRTFPIADPVESWVLPYFPEVDHSDPMPQGEADRQRCGCPFDYHMADCPILTDRSGESEMGSDDDDGDRPERIPDVPCGVCGKLLDPDYDDDWETKVCEDCQVACDHSDTRVCQAIGHATGPSNEPS